MEKTKSYKVFEDTFNLEPLDQSNVPVVQSDNADTSVLVGDSRVDDSLTFAEDKIKSSIETAATALKDLVSLAKQEENLRAYEAISSYMSSITASSAKLVEMRQRQFELELKARQMGQDKSQQNSTTTSNVAGTTPAKTSDVLKAINDEDK